MCCCGGNSSSSSPTLLSPLSHTIQMTCVNHLALRSISPTGDNSKQWTLLPLLSHRHGGPKSIPKAVAAQAKGNLAARRCTEHCTDHCWRLRHTGVLARTPDPMRRCLWRCMCWGIPQTEVRGRKTVGVVLPARPQSKISDNIVKPG